MRYLQSLSRPKHSTGGVIRALAALTTVVAALVAAASVSAEQLPPGSVRVAPNVPGKASALRWKASFDQPTAAELQAYNVDIARGYRFDPRAVSGRCSLAAAQSGHCPANSAMGSGRGRVTVITGPGQSQDFALGISFYIMRPQRPGDIAGLVLAAHEPAAGITFDLIGRLVRLRRGPYGLELRFANTASELPHGITVQLHQVNVHFGTRRTVTRGHGAHRRRRVLSLLRNPPTCRHGGWRFLLTVKYSTGTERYSALGACAAQRG